MTNKGLSTTFREGVAVEETHRAVEQVIMRAPGGCGGCGLTGFDMMLTAEADPQPYEAL
jgi:hypothetical protein